MHATAPAIPGLSYVTNYLSLNERVELLAVIDRLPWSGDLKRRVQHYGYRYDYTRKTIDHDLYLGPLPGWARTLEKRFLHDGHAPRQLNQLIVNEYLPGQGIAPHVDCVPCFADTVLSLSLGSSCVLTMSQRKAEMKLPVLLEQGSLLVMTGEARYDWLHGIASRKNDRYEGQTLSRGRRVSLTFRTVLR